LSRLLFAFGIRHIGSGAAKLIADYAKDIENLFSVTVEELSSIGDVGLIMAESVVEFFSQPHVREIVDQLKNAGVNTKVIEKEATGSSLSNLTFVITGTLPTLGRSEAKALIEQNGGKVTGSVSKKTDFLLCGEDAGSKLQKAKELNIKIIDENELFAMMG